MVDGSIEYYNSNAQKYYKDTISVDLTHIYNLFLERIPDGGSILDAGCGSGRDSLYFIKLGYDVVAFDASDKMVEISSKLIGKKVYRMTFEDFSLDKNFDGIWACASLLHIKKTDITLTVNRLAKVLRKKGAFYMSYKYGTNEYEKDSRLFNCYDEESFKALVDELESLKIIELFITEDVRPSRKSEKWLNCLLEKIN